ncbi:MAG: hypothetical protein ABSB09_00905 [Acidimicrobiales bacterium]
MVRRESRYTSRALARIDSQTEIGLAEIESKAELQAAKVSAIGYVGKRALMEVAGLSNLEQRLTAIDPASIGRYQAIVDIVAVEAAGVVSETARRVSR